MATSATVWAQKPGNGFTSFTDPGVGGVGIFFGMGGSVLPSLNPNGVIGGGQIGYDWQVSPRWVLGFVTDLEAADARASATAAAPNLVGFIGITESNSAELDWLGTVRGRFGVVGDNNLLYYGTAGLAYGHVRASTAFNDPSFKMGANPISFAGSTSSTRTGWTAGAGVEYSLTPNWRFGAQYLYVDLGTISVTETQATGTVATGNTFTSKSKFAENIVRLVISYKFGP